MSAKAGFTLKKRPSAVLLQIPMLFSSKKAKDGRPVQSQVWLDCLPPPPKPDTPYQFIKIARREFHGTIDTFKVKDFINKPGEYYIEVTFNSFLSRDFIQKYFANDPIAKLPLWTMDNPTVNAPPIH